MKKNIRSIINTEKTLINLPKNWLVRKKIRLLNQKKIKPIFNIEGILVNLFEIN